MVFLPPEAHRTDTGQLQEPTLGIAFILEAVEKELEESESQFPGALCLPFGVYLTKSESRGLSLLAKVRVRAGEPFSLAAIRQEIKEEGRDIEGREDLRHLGRSQKNRLRRRLLTDRIMLRIAELLPVKRRGAYGDRDSSHRIALISQER